MHTKPIVVLVGFNNFIEKIGGGVSQNGYEVYMDFHF